MEAVKKSGTCRRMVAMLLSLAMILGLYVPVQAEPLSSGAPPATITLKESTYSGETFNTPELGNAMNRVVIANASGYDDAPMFCADHTKDLNITPGTITWGNPVSIDEYEGGKYKVVKPFVSRYYYAYYNNKWIADTYPDLPDGNGEDEAHKDPYLTKMDVAKDVFHDWYENRWSQVLESSYPQSATWLAGFDKLTDLTDEAQLLTLARVVQNAYHSMMPEATVTDEAVQERLSSIKAMIESYNLYGFTDGVVKGGWDFYIYTPQNGNNQQIMLYGVPKQTVEEKYEAWVTLNKTSTDGVVLSGAEFTAYTDERCTNPVEPAAIGTTGADGTLTLKVTWEDSSPTETFYIKETAAPSGYTLSDTVYAVQVTNEVNTESNPALVNGGQAITNAPPPPPIR